MTITFQVHFDGNSIIPDEHIELPVDRPLQIVLTVLGSQKAETGGNELIEQRLRKLQRASGRIEAPVISDESLRRENLYDERP